MNLFNADCPLMKYPMKNVEGAEYSDIKDLMECLTECKDNPECTGVDFK